MRAGPLREVSRDSEDNAAGLLGNIERPVLDLECKVTSYHADIPLQRSMLLSTSNCVHEKIPYTNTYRFLGGITRTKNSLDRPSVLNPRFIHRPSGNDYSLCKGNFVNFLSVAKPPKACCD